MARARVTIAVVACLACHSAPNLELGPIPAGVSVDSQLQYYDVSAGTLSEIRQAMVQEGPRTAGRRWGAVTSWNLSWTYQTLHAGLAGCEARHVRVRVRVVTNFPRWNPTAEPDSALIAWWYQFNAGLAEHERGHALLAVEGAKAMVQDVEGMQGSCGTLASGTTMAFEKDLAAMNAKQVEYDRTTRHGATQIQTVRRLHEP